ncbi:hypothetical protein XELAEV_18010580mg [Xenopus laevis]|uniref:Uncharacterized protein n=1 Tax=Xenopus laevis TaxID=8355 RepID=A0A974DUG4_XENLA|nr:hypothetical protein XELAEV_18010580mg [Xenopus laevis]
MPFINYTLLSLNVPYDTTVQVKNTPRSEEHTLHRTIVSFFSNLCKSFMCISFVFYRNLEAWIIFTFLCVPM